MHEWCVVHVYELCVVLRPEDGVWCPVPLPSALFPISQQMGSYVSSQWALAILSLILNSAWVRKPHAWRSMWSLRIWTQVCWLTQVLLHTEPSPQSSLLFVLFCFLWALANLEFRRWALLCLFRAGFKGVCYHAWLRLVLILVSSLTYLLNFLVNTSLLFVLSSSFLL